MICSIYSCTQHCAMMVPNPWISNSCAESIQGILLYDSERWCTTGEKHPFCQSLEKKFLFTMICWHQFNCQDDLLLCIVICLPCSPFILHIWAFVPFIPLPLPYLTIAMIVSAYIPIPDFYNGSTTTLPPFVHCTFLHYRVCVSQYLKKLVQARILSPLVAPYKSQALHFFPHFNQHLLGLSSMWRRHPQEKLQKERFFGM